MAKAKQQLWELYLVSEWCKRLRSSSRCLKKVLKPSRSPRIMSNFKADRGFSFERNCVLRQSELIHSDEGLTLETSVFESFTVANLPYRPCG